MLAIWPHSTPALINGALLYRELRARGYQGGASMVRAYLRRWRHDPGRVTPDQPSRVRHGTLRTVAVRVLRAAENRTDADHALIAHLQAVHPAVAEAIRLAQAFAAMVRSRHAAALAPWLAEAQASEVRALRAFARRLSQDEAAVMAALTSPFSNGPVEGNINRLKFLKRQMYGRAGLRLLEARVCGIP
jgi:transposase